MYLLLLAETAFIETFSFSLHNWKLKLKWHQMANGPLQGQGH